MLISDSDIAIRNFCAARISSTLTLVLGAFLTFSKIMAKNSRLPVSINGSSILSSLNLS